MNILNTKYAHLGNDRLVRHVLLKDSNPLAVELAKRFEHCDCSKYVHECEECGIEEDNLVAAEGEVARLKKVIEGYDL